jgi:hypothetical protein
VGKIGISEDVQGWPPDRSEYFLIKNILKLAKQ